MRGNVEYYNGLVAEHKVHRCLPRHSCAAMSTSMKRTLLQLHDKVSIGI